MYKSHVEFKNDMEKYYLIISTHKKTLFCAWSSKIWKFYVSFFFSALRMQSCRAPKDYLSPATNPSKILPILTTTILIQKNPLVNWAQVINLYRGCPLVFKTKSESREHGYIHSRYILSNYIRLSHNKGIKS